MKRSFMWPQDEDKKDKVIEIYVANDNSQYVSTGSNINAVFQRAKDIVNSASLLYQPLDIYLVIVGMEVWNDSDKIQVSAANASTTLGSWCDYRMRNINPVHYNDAGLLLTHVEFLSDYVYGKSYSGQMCSNRFSGSIIRDVLPSAASTGVIVAREIGYSLGLSDDSASCPCEDKSGHCIMNSVDGSSALATNWSSCSISQLSMAFQHGIDICMYNVPQTITDSICGNGIVEDGEQCDCGNAPVNECNRTCCSSTTCKLTKSATCASGRCCDVSKCQIVQAGRVCRPKTNDCDLPESCDGSQALCPPDTYKPDGADCVVNLEPSYCFGGQCRSQTSQCELLWGPGTLASNLICYYNFNVHGEDYGNCGLSWLPITSYVPCQRSDAMCGTLQCQNDATLLYYYQNYVNMTRTSIDNYPCNSVIFDYGLNTQDPGLVPNGAKCGDKQMCVNQRCVNISDIRTVPCAEACDPDAVCNNIGHCQKLVVLDQGNNAATVTGSVVGYIDVIMVFMTLIGLRCSSDGCPDIITLAFLAVTCCSLGSTWFSFESSSYLA